MLKTISRPRFLNILPYFVIACLAVLFFIRAFFGFDWSDESYYLALPYRFALGDRFFADSWDIHQLGAMLVAPLLWLYRRVVGDMTGIILFTRLLYVLFQTLVSLLVYRAVLVMYQSRIPALLCAALCLSFTPFSISNFSYNTMGYLFVLVAAMTLFFLYGGSPHGLVRAAVLSALSGAALACACIAYPFFATVILSFVALLMGLRPRILLGGAERASLWPFVFFLGGGFSVGGAALVYLLASTGVQGIARNILYLFADPEHPYESVWVKTSMFLKDYYHLVFLALMQITLLVLLFLYRGVESELDLSDIFRLLIRVCLPLSMILNVVTVLVEPELTAPMTAKVNFVQACAGFWPLILFLHKPGRRSLVVLFLLYLPALLMCWSIYVASNNGITGASYVLILSVMAGMLIVYDYYRPTAQNREKTSERRILNAVRLVLLAFGIFLVACNAVLRVQAVYRDEPVRRLHVQMRTGPAKGIYTTAASAAAYHGIVADIEVAVPQDGRVMFLELLPFGYLCSDQKPAPPSLWRTKLPSERVDEFFDARPQNRPALLYVVKSPYGMNNGQTEITMEEAEKILGGSVAVKETEYSYQFTKK